VEEYLLHGETLVALATFLGEQCLGDQDCVWLKLSQECSLGVYLKKQPFYFESAVDAAGS